tara:strand:- start:854 stop:1138 length:285 start_codon:yes stop_codon:yes gene_type:complete
MNSLAMLGLFLIVIYIANIYANNKYGKDKEFVVVKEVVLPTTFYDYLKPKNLLTSYATMFGIDGEELNLINSTNDIENKKKSNKVFVPQRFFIN